MAKNSTIKLTPEQIANWRNLFPLMRYMTDEQIQDIRDSMQEKVNEEAQSTPGADDDSLEE